MIRVVVGRRMAFFLKRHAPQHQGKGDELLRRTGQEMKGGKSYFALKASRRYCERTGSSAVYSGLCRDASWKYRREEGETFLNLSSGTPMSDSYSRR